MDIGPGKKEIETVFKFDIIIAFQDGQEKGFPETPRAD